jgi:MFS-type transporter involved in bile tolerance (Atg22 family)
MCKTLFAFGVVAGLMAANAAWLAPSVAKRGGSNDLLMLMLVVSIVCAAIGLYGADIEDKNRNDEDKKG